MFIGHDAVALGARRAAPTVSLGVLFLACPLADLVWPTLVLPGIDRVEIRPGDTVVTPLHFAHDPDSHSLLGVAAVAWSAQALWLLIAWAFWIDRHRTGRSYG